MNPLLKTLKEGDILLTFNEQPIERAEEIATIRSFVFITNFSLYLKVIKEPRRPKGTVHDYNLSYDQWHKVNAIPKDLFDLKLGITTGKYILENKDGIIPKEIFKH